MSPPSSRFAVSTSAITRGLTTAWSRSASVVQSLAERTATGRRAPARLAGLDAHHSGHVEVNRLGRFLAALAFVAACLLVSTWSRIDLRRTSLQLHQAEEAFDASRAEHARLRMELASLQAPAQLDAVATDLTLEPATSVVKVPAN